MKKLLLLLFSHFTDAGIGLDTLKKLLEYHSEEVVDVQKNPGLKVKLSHHLSISQKEEGNCQIKYSIPS